MGELARRLSPYAGVTPVRFLRSDLSAQQATLADRRLPPRDTHLKGGCPGWLRQRDGKVLPRHPLGGSVDMGKSLVRLEVVHASAGRAEGWNRRARAEEEGSGSPHLPPSRRARGSFPPSQPKPGHSPPRKVAGPEGGGRPPPPGPRHQTNNEDRVLANGTEVGLGRAARAGGANGARGTR